MRCEKCGKELNHININMFARDGRDYYDNCSFEECEENAVVIDIDSSWTGYGLSNEDKLETIKCPYCNQFPFEDKEIQEYEIVRLVMFKRTDEDVD